VVDIYTVIATTGASESAAGTGLVLTPSGLVLTNNHVVRGATSIRVSVQGRSGGYAAVVVGVDPADDIALVQIQGVSGLPTVTLGDSSSVIVGETVVALGNAGGTGGAPSVSEGRVNGLDQSITAADDNGGSERLSGLIESDASISPGDSGGALINSAGQVVGIITAGESTSPEQTSTTVGYAITSNAALAIANQILSGRSSASVYIGPTGYLGVGVIDLNPRVAARLGLQVDSGALVESVAQGSPAASAGIRSGSVLTAVGSTTISSAAELGPALWTHKPGQKVRVTWVDQDGAHTTSVTLASGPVA
jgi:S1-C subfamily serine protease